MKEGYFKDLKNVYEEIWRNVFDFYMVDLNIMVVIVYYVEYCWCE